MDMVGRQIEKQRFLHGQHNLHSSLNPHICSKTPSMAAFAKSSKLHVPQRDHPNFPTTSKLKPFTFTHNFHTLYTHFRNSKHFGVSTSVTTTNISASISSHDPNSDICKLCLLGNLERAMSYLESMHQLQVTVEEDSYVALVRLCEWKRARKEGSCVMLERKVVLI